MTVAEKLGALGSWSVQLSDHTPEEVKRSLDYFGHVAVVRGRVNPADHGDALLRAARYVGVLRRRQGEQEMELSGAGMVFWLGDEDDKGAVLESKVTLTNATLAQSVAAVLPDSVQLGQILANPSGTYTGTHQWQTPREALQVICDAFGVEFRVNGDATVDVGTRAQLYATTPDSIVVRKGAGSDLDLSALSGRFEPDASVIDYSTRVVLLGRTEDNGTIATGSAELDEVQFVDLHGNPVRFVRLISESEQTEGSVQPRAQLQLNRFARTARSLKVTAERYETDGAFLVGDNAYVYDPDTGIVSPDHEVSFRGQVLHPDVIRVVGVTWPVSEDHTVAFRTQAGEWIDLTRWVVWESGDNELTLGDLPRSLLGGGGNPILDRTATPADTIAPNPPTGLTLSSWTATGADGHESGFIDAAWTAPTVNEDGSVVTDLSHYLVAWRHTSGPRWQYATVAATEATLQATVGLPYEVFVGAYDRSNNFSGWSAVETIAVAADSTAPNAPADPVVTDYLMQLRIEYPGVDANGDPMPSDAARVDAEVASASGGPWTVVSSLSPFVKGVAYATAPTDAPTFVRLVAYDHTGNASTPSGVVSGTTSKIVGDDILDGAVGTAKLANLAVVTAKIADLAVNDAKIGNLNVGKLISGFMIADVVISGSFTTTPTPAGRHVSITSDAIEAWADNTHQTIRLDGAANLLTGTFQTALVDRRMVLGAAGATGEISFYAPDGTRSIIRAWTEGGDGDTEAIQFGIPINGNGLWNLINYNSSARGEYATYRSGTHEFIFDTGAHQLGLDDSPNAGRFVVFETGDRGSTPSKSRLTIDRAGEAHIYPETGVWNVRSRTSTGTLRERLTLAAASSFMRLPDAAAFGMDTGRLGYWQADGLVRWLITNNALSYWHSNGQERLTVDANNLTVRDDSGTIRFTVRGDTADDVWFQWPGTSGRVVLVSPGAGTLTRSGKINMANGHGYFSDLSFYSDSGGANWRVEVTAGGTYSPFWCQVVTEISMREAKTGIASFTDDALATVRGIAVRRFRYRGAKVEDGTELDPGPEMLGVIADEAPEEIVTRNEHGKAIGVRPSAQIALLTRAVQQLADQVDDLTRKKDAA